MTTMKGRDMLAGMALLAGVAACQRQEARLVRAPSAGIQPVSADLPRRRPGLWIETVTRDGHGPPWGSVRMCLDAATDARASLLGRAMSDAACAHASARVPAGIAFTARCRTAQGALMTAKGLATGDFASRYHVRVETELTGASMPGADGRHVAEVEARYAGPCPDGVAPGDIVLGPGLKMNINRLPAALGQFGAG